MNTNTVTFIDDQAKAFEAITSYFDVKMSNILKPYNIESNLLSLTGAAGTGKSFLITEIIRYCVKKEYGVVVTAPTHKAVSVIATNLSQEKLQVSSKTIHSFLGIKPFRDYNTGEEKYKIDKNTKIHSKTDILIVDESSMIGGELYEYIVEAVIKGRTGVVLFVGDPYQLLPVNEQANEIFQLPNQYKLNKIVRQAQDNEIIQLATELRKRIKTKEFIPLEEILLPYKEKNSKDIIFFHNQEEFLEDFYKNKNFINDEDKIIASNTNKNVDAFNKIVRNYYWGLKNVYKPQTLIKGDYLRFKESYSIKGVTLFHNNQVVPVKEAKKLWHESLKIEFWECKTQSHISEQNFRVVEPSYLYEYNQKLHDIAKKAKKAKFPKNRDLWKLFFSIKNMFADVQYIYASTIHKLQGSTIDEVYMDLYGVTNNEYLSNEEKYRLTYVALTRAKNKAKIFVHNFDEIYQSNLNSQEYFNQIDNDLQLLDI